MLLFTSICPVEAGAFVVCGAVEGAACGAVAGAACGVMVILLVTVLWITLF
jgi:hypothetical protein